MTRDSRDLDGVIDEVAQAMTGATLPRDLRPAIAGRLGARQPWWPIGWRAATAAAALAVVLVAVVVVSRPGGEPPQPRAVAEVVTRPPVSAGGEPRPVALDRVAAIEPRPERPVARLGRQTIAAATPGIVEIDPVAIVPLKGDDVAPGALAPSQVVAITPIELEPVRISQLAFAE